MRSVAEIRDLFLEELHVAVYRPAMVTIGGMTGAEEFFRTRLSDLCFIDERGDALRNAIYVYAEGCGLIQGRFTSQQHPFPCYFNEVVSVYAEIAFGLGYLTPCRRPFAEQTPSRLLTETEMAGLISEVNRESFRKRDWTKAELRDRFGPPFLNVGGGQTTVLCYAGEAPGAKWVFFDLTRQLPGASDWLPDPIARDVRYDLLNRMHLFPFGERWVRGEILTPSPSP